MIDNLFLGRLSLDALPLDNPIILAAGALMVGAALSVIGVITYYGKWSYIWHNWITTVDHKKLGVLYMILAGIMLARGVIEALLMRAQQAVAAGGNMGFLPPEHYNQFFSEHGVIMIFFVAMPLMFGLINLIVPLQIGARDVAYPYLNNFSFWMTFVGAMLLNVSLVIGHFATAGWLSYPPMSELHYNPGPGVDYYVWSLQISGVGTLLAGINFIATIFKMRAPGMTLMKMPVFVWSALCAMILVALAFPILTVVLALLELDRMIGMHFFTQHAGGNMMMYINLIWAWGHPEVYIVILPAFGIFSEVVATFSRKRLFGYTTMVYAIAAITFLSFIVWVHHFFTMGSGANVNAFFGITTMIIAIPTGVKVFNWLFTMYKGKIHLTTPMLWVMAFFTTFAIGGMTGVLMSVPPVDFQTHNSLFLVAHFHNTLIGGALFGFFAGFIYWFPKAFGFTLDERLGKYAFVFWVAGFYIAFMPLYVLGLAGVMRRTNHYANVALQPYFIIAAFGAVLIFIGVALQIYQLVISIKNRHALKDKTGDPWDGRTLEWSVASPAPEYNFALIPTVSKLDQYWEDKQNSQRIGLIHPDKLAYQDIHMPKNTASGFIISVLSGVVGFALVWHIWAIAIVGLIAIIGVVIARSFATDIDYYIKADDVRKNELKHFKEAVS
jgi:cytochrome o ubiquinol oxidase subunit 1